MFLKHVYILSYYFDNFLKEKLCNINNTFLWRFYENKLFFFFKQNLINYLCRKFNNLKFIILTILLFILTLFVFHAISFIKFMLKFINLFCKKIPSYTNWCIIIASFVQVRLGQVSNIFSSNIQRGWIVYHVCNCI